MHQLSDDIRTDQSGMDLSNSNDDTIIMMSDSYRVVTADSGQVTFVRSHRAPRGLGTLIFLIGIGSALLGMAIFGVGAVFGAVID